jgi:hypothetical protein
VTLWSLKHYVWGQAGDHGGAEYTIDVLMGNSWLTLLTTLWFTEVWLTEYGINTKSCFT